MKLSTKTKDIIANFASINNAMLFRPGKRLSTITKTGSLLGIASIDEEIQQQFAIHDLSKFLSILSTFSDPVLEVDEQYVIISSGKTTYKYRRAALDVIVYPDSLDMVLDDPVASFKLASEDLANIIEVASISKHPEVIFAGEDGSLLLQTHGEKGIDAYSHVVGKTDNTFQIRLKLESLSMLMPNDYAVIIADTACKFESKTLQYFIAGES